MGFTETEVVDADAKGRLGFTERAVATAVDALDVTVAAANDDATAAPAVNEATRFVVVVKDFVRVDFFGDGVTREDARFLLGTKVDLLDAIVLVVVMAAVVSLMSNRL